MANLSTKIISFINFASFINVTFYDCYDYDYYADYVDSNTFIQDQNILLIIFPSYDSKGHIIVHFLHSMHGLHGFKPIISVPHLYSFYNINFFYFKVDLNCSL